MNVVHMLLHVLHHQPTDVARGLLLVSSAQVFPQMHWTLENFSTHIAGSRLAVFSMTVVEQGTVRVEETVTLVTRDLNFLRNFLRVWSAFVSALVQAHRDFVAEATLLVAEMNHSVVLCSLNPCVEHHPTVAVSVILPGHQ